MLVIMSVKYCLINGGVFWCILWFFCSFVFAVFYLVIYGWSLSIVSFVWCVSQVVGGPLCGSVFDVSDIADASDLFIL